MAARSLRRSFTLAAVAAVALVASACAPSPSPVRRDPVIIVAGTFVAEPIAGVYALLQERLVRDGYRPFLYVLPDAGLGDIPQTAAGLARYVEQVRGIAGAAHVDLVGHSQGGLVSRYYVKQLGGSTVVDSLISLSAPHYGTGLANLGTLFGFGDCLGMVACRQMAVGSSFLADLNAGPDQIGDVTYTNFGTRLDEVVVPYTSSFLINDARNTNVDVQGQCPLRLMAHVTIATDGAVYSGVRAALRHEPVALDCFAL